MTHFFSVQTRASGMKRKDVVDPVYVENRISLLWRKFIKWIFSLFG